MSRFAAKYLVLLWFLNWCSAEKLDPDQKAPLFARGSAGLVLEAPMENGPPSSDSISSNNNVDGVEREESEMLKAVDGQLIRVVKGHFSYNSPEGTPVFVKYEADENGNRASFRIGKAASESSKTSGSSAKTPGTSRPKEPSPGVTYLPPNDKTYLPPN
ncbi:uncharacterized protein [Prorops nasuta]|uniref:uncharacterized protein n=1 Tax=Prorops nasuta TaxID=863751 RepID=UPI0034CDD72E